MLDNLKARLGTRTLVLIGILAVVAVFAAAFSYLSATKPAKVKTMEETAVVPAPAPVQVEPPVQKFDAAPVPQAANGSGLPGAPESPASPPAKSPVAPAAQTGGNTTVKPAEPAGPKEIPIAPQAPATPVPQTAKPGPSEIPPAPAAKPAAPAPTVQAPAKPVATVQTPAPKATTPAPVAAVAAATPIPAAAGAAPGAGSYLYVYQVASYKDAVPAQHDKDRLDKAGVKARIEQAEVNGGKWNRVRAEFTGPADQLKEFTAKLRQAGFKEFIQISKTPAR